MDWRYLVPEAKLFDGGYRVKLLGFELGICWGTDWEKHHALEFMFWGIGGKICSQCGIVFPIAETYPLFWGR